VAVSVDLGAARVLGSGSWICPVQGPRAFSDDFGDPRSGGRSHQGNDIMAPRGTPVVASVAGTVKGHNSSLGGISYYLNGDDGNTYFGTHLDRLSGASGRVAAGTVIGYVGSTGNASASAPHLHFEMHPGGGRAVNPYATLRKFC
jgi:peptidoglycan LD-endopeptidase LytH